jgi:hypothetical protein
MIVREIMNPREPARMDLLSETIERVRISAIAAEISRISIAIAGLSRP